jgi:hypothetical protein
MSIQLSFDTVKLRQICENFVSAKRSLGSLAGKSLHARLADLRASSSPLEMVNMGFAGFRKSSDARIFIYIEGGYAVEAVVSNRPEPRLGDGRLDWNQVSRLKILSIERANEN